MKINCTYTKGECHHFTYKCSECPVIDLICDEFYDCIDAAYRQGAIDALDRIKNAFNNQEA